MRGNNRGNRGGYNGRRVNAATAANAIPVKDEGIGHVNSTQASDAFDLLLYKPQSSPSTYSTSPLAIVNATLTHSFCTTKPAQISDSTTGPGSCILTAAQTITCLVIGHYSSSFPGLTVNLISTSATPWEYEWTIYPNKMALKNRKIVFLCPKSQRPVQCCLQQGEN